MGINYTQLSDKYGSKQRFCWYIYDVIGSILRDCDKEGRAKIKFKFKNEKEANDFDKKIANSDTIIDAMYENGYKQEATHAIGMDIFRATLADMLQFIYESLATMEKKKISVSYALLRKPFRDNLLYLEWLLSNPNELTDLLYKNDIDKYAIEKISKDDKIKIIKSSIEHIKDNKEYFSKINYNIFYDIRYNYNAPNSLQLIWNKANHLVTTHRKTRTNEMNFIFLKEEDYSKFIDYYYEKIPNLLFYTYNIVVELYHRFIREVPNTTRIYNNIFVWSRYLDILNDDLLKQYLKVLDDDIIIFLCECCKTAIKVNINDEDFEEFMFDGFITCNNCGSEINARKYFFLEDYNNKS